MTVFIAGRTPARIFHEMTDENPPEEISGEGSSYGKNGQVLAGADDLIQLIDRKVIVGKNITT
jgi:hypothetical protein